VANNGTIRNPAADRFFSQAKGTDVLEQLTRGVCQGLLEDTLMHLASYINNNGRRDLARILFDTFGPEGMLRLMEPQFKARLFADMMVDSKLSEHASPDDHRASYGKDRSHMRSRPKHH
jgi:hypothetical protein